MKIKILLFSILLTAISCQTDEESNQVDYQNLYWETLNGDVSKSSSTLFSELTESEKIGVWEFKMDRFIDDNELTSDQLNSIQILKDFNQGVNSLDELEIQKELLQKFDFKTTTILLGQLANQQEDLSLNTKSCWWCWEVVGVTNPCHMEYRNGEAIGYYQTITVQRRGAFGIRNGAPMTGILAPCGTF